MIMRTKIRHWGKEHEVRRHKRQPRTAVIGESIVRYVPCGLWGKIPHFRP